MLQKNYKFLLFFLISSFLYVVLVASFYKTTKKVVQEAEVNLVNQAQLHYEDIANTRAWNSEVGGVYIYRDQQSCDVNHKTIEDSNGRKMIRVNPAYMTKMLSESSSSMDYKFTLVGQKSLNEKNEDDIFYIKSLNEISKMSTLGDTRRYTIDANKTIIKYIHGVYLTKDCMSCHADLGDKLGALAGGISVEISAGAYFDHVNEIWDEFYRLLLLATLVLLFLNIVGYKLFQRAEKIVELNKKLEGKIKLQATKLEYALEGAELGSWHWNVQTDEHLTDERWREMLGVDEDDMENTKEDWSLRVHPDDIDRVLKVIEKAIVNHTSYVVEFRMQHNNGEYVWIQGSGGVISYDKEGKPLELAGTHQDITQRKKLEEKAKKNSIYLNTLFDKNPNIIIITNGDKLLKANEAFFNFFNKYNSLNDFLQKHDCVCEYFEQEENENFITDKKDEWVLDVFNKEQPITKISYYGNTKYFALNAKRIYEDNTTHYMVTLSEITDMYNLKKEYKQLSIVDPLTGLYNRRFFNTVFTKEVNRAMRLKTSLTFLILDVDFFKAYNDNYGHDMGDVLLKKLAVKLQETSKRSTEFVFRLGGEEFCIMCSGLTKEKAKEHVNGILDAVEGMQISHHFSQASQYLSVSIGYYYIDGSEYINEKTIYKNADLALYNAKESGRNRVVDFDTIEDSK